MNKEVSDTPIYAMFVSVSFAFKGSFQRHPGWAVLQKCQYLEDKL